MKVLFIYPNINTGNGAHYVHGLGSLVSACRRHGHQSEVMLLNESVHKDGFLKNITQSNPDFIAFSFSTHQWPHVKQLAGWASETDRPVVAGGVHATFDADRVIADGRIDYVIRGEGEGALPDLLNGILHTQISNLMGKNFTNDLRPLIEDLDSLPVYDRAEFPMETILQVNGHELTLMAGRGCPWPCTYCCNPAWQRLYRNKGRYVRFRSLDHLFSEIDLLCSHYRVDSLYFEDDIFTLDQEWCEGFCREYPRRFDLPFRLYLKVGNVDRATLKRLHAAGLRLANIGIESGSARVRREILKRPMSDDQIHQLFSWCRELGIRTRAFNILGFPGESTDEIDQTFALNERVLPDHVQVSLFHPYPGTVLFDQCLRQEIYSGVIRESYFTEETVLDLPDRSQTELQAKYRSFCNRAREIEIRAFHESLLSTSPPPGSLLPLFGGAKIDYQGPVPIALEEVTIKQESRFCISAHPRSRIIFQIFTTGKSQFVSDLALNPLCLEWGGGGVRFSIALRNGDEEQLIASKRIDPKHNPADLGWNPWAVPLPDVKTTSLVMRTDPDEDGDLTGAWALWGAPRLEPIE